jgi:beta-phosphoglucomutase-like phosphatase (HAD superfamily)
MRNTGSVGAFIFDMDGTMVDSMPWHAKCWVEFTRLHELDIPLDEVMRRTTGRTGPECMRVLFQREFDDDQCDKLVQQKEQLYRALFAPVFAEVDGFKRFEGMARARGLKVGVGTAGDKHNIAFVLQHLRLAQTPHAMVGGDEGFPGKPEPAIFLEAARRLQVDPESCIVFEDAPFGIESARRAGMRAVAVCTTHSPAQLAGPHVLAAVRDYTELMNSSFLENLHVA